jgi:hypothetical protein
VRSSTRGTVQDGEVVRPRGHALRRADRHAHPNPG